MNYNWIFRLLRFSRTRSAGSRRTNSELASRVDFGTSLSRRKRIVLAQFVCDEASEAMQEHIFALRRLPLRILEVKLFKGVAFPLELSV